MSTLFDNEAQVNALVEQKPIPADHLTPGAIIAGMIERGQDPQPMMAIFREWEDRIAAEAYGHALSVFQAKCPQIVKRRQIDLGGGKGPLFASLDDIMAVIKPILADSGLSVRFSAGMTDGGQLTATCFIRHGRHEESSEVTLPVPSQMRVNDTQKMGAALSYAKRYALCAALNIVVTDEDSDAHGMVGAVDENQLATLTEWVESLAGTKFKLPSFLRWLGVASLAEIPRGDFDKAVSELQRAAHSFGVAK